MSQAMNDLRGSLVALVTPMTASNAMGRIDVGIRLPLVELTAPVQAEVRRRLEALGVL